MRIAITGASGFAGNAILKECQNRGHDTIAFGGRYHVDLCSQLSKFKGFLKHRKPHVLIHAAGAVAGIMGNKGDANWSQYAKNTEMATLVMKGCQQLGIEKVISLGSSCQYPRDAEQPFEVSSLGTGSFEETNWGYALAKENLRHMGDQLGYKMLIPPNLYGPGDKSGPNSHFIQALVDKAVALPVERNRGILTCNMMGSPKTERELLYIDDLAKMVVIAAEDYDWIPRVTNIGWNWKPPTIGCIWNLILLAAEKVGVSSSWDDLNIGMPTKSMSVPFTLESHFRNTGIDPTGLDSGIHQTVKSTMAWARIAAEK